MKTLYSDHKKPSDPSKIKRVMLLIAVFAAAFIIRTYWINVHPAVFHPVRQYQTALLSRAFFLNTDEFRYDIGRIPSLMFHNYREKIDPRINETLNYWMYRIVGREDMSIGRWLSVLYWIIGGVILYKIGVLLFGFTGAFISLSVYLFFPFGINISQSIQPESLLNLLFLWAVHQIVKHFKSEKGDYFYSAALLSGFAVMVKITIIFPILGILVFSGIRKSGLKKYIFNWRTVWFYTIFLSIGTYFYVYNIFWNRTMQNAAVTLISPGLLLKPIFWTGWLTQIGKVTGIIPFLLALVLLFTVKNREVKFTMAGLYTGYMAYAMIFSYTAATHDYYQLALFPITALMLGQVGTLLDSGGKKRFVGKFAVFTVLAACAVFSFVHWNRFMWKEQQLNKFSPAFFTVGEQGSYFTNNIPEKDIAKTAEKIGELTGYGINNIFLSRSYGNTVMYYGKVFGMAWPTEDDFWFRRLQGNVYPPAGELFKTKFAPLKPRYFIVTDLDEWKAQPGLRHFLEGNYRVFAKEPGFIIFDLRGRI